MKFYFVLNPKAGKGGHTQELEKNIRLVCEKKEIPFEIYMTTGVGDATAFVKKICSDGANLPARFYACGGDGTFGEVVNGAADTAGASVGVIPVGTGNDFVRNFAPAEAFFDIEAQISGEETRIDLLKCNDSYAVNMINIGFDCEVVKKTAKLKKNALVPSKLAYIAGVVSTLIKKPGVRASVSFDGSEFTDKRYLLTTFANGSFCGGGFHSNPFSSLTDKKVDGLLINNVSRMKFISLIGSYKKGTHIVPKNDSVLKNGKYEKIIFKFPQTQSASIDGEIFDFDELCIECVPNAIDIILPAGVSNPYAEKTRETVMA
ncbi:MAG: YegS/Rv2252/BmrU family lipid kinase [Clostridia bacterium]|nr:YegS/Rv2252/BmrU family lipid kinase [Clostridia bacterium]